MCRARGTVTDAMGDPINLTVEGFVIWLVGEIPGVGTIGSGSTDTGQPGGFLFADIPAVGYEIQVFEEQGMVRVGTGRAFVRADEITDVTVVLDRDYERVAPWSPRSTSGWRCRFGR
jgi:hypothetical protein